MTAIALPLQGTTPRRLPAGARRRHAPSVYRRRRVAVLLGIVSAVVGGHAALEAFGGGPLTAVEGRQSLDGTVVIELDTQPVAKATYVVRSGDTLWTIARRIQPQGDVRPLVDALAAERDGRPLQPGERIAVP
ncbi:MAG TPA: LysM domain-containing protein [Acidimicrobiales bacterium]|jgi:nucleoid-associated protein YgaU|nr:LysM domain-containing protein [Acidimicrobiales bacterium]